MQSTRNNCFGSKKRSTTLRQAKTGKHEGQNVKLLLHFGTRAYLFSTRNNCCEFPAFYGVTFPSVIKSYFKTPVFGAPLSKVNKSVKIASNRKQTPATVSLYNETKFGLDVL